MRLIITAFLVAAFVGAPAIAAAERRLALVIGNSSYATISDLANPVSDARLIDGALRNVGFETTLLLDAGQNDIKRAIAAFGRALRGAGRDAVGLFYYAGHGIQANGVNYLIPVDGDFVDEADLDIFAINANWVLSQMESAGAATNIVVLDACRNNPLTSSFRAATRGLARINAPTGSFVAYATSPGDVAQDGDGANSPYSLALSKAIATPGLPIEKAFKAVRVDVLGATGGLQTPWDSSSLVNEFYFVTPASTSASTPQTTTTTSAPPRKSRIAQATESWAYFKDSEDIAALGDFAEEFADTPFGSLARARIASLRDAAKAPAPRAVEPAAKPPIVQQPAIRPDWCPRARSATEKAICADPQLSAMDVDLGRIYAARLSRLSEARKKRAVKSQRAWLGLRNACGDEVDCIAPLYRERIIALTR